MNIVRILILFIGFFSFSVHAGADSNVIITLMQGAFVATDGLDAPPTRASSQHALHEQQSTAITRRHANARHQESLHRQMHPQALAYENQPLDKVWYSSTASDVRHRCTVINFLNGPFGAQHSMPPSPLPKHFCDDFTPRSWVESRFPGNRSAHHYREHFKSTLCGCNPQECSRLARAAMRAWRDYHYPGYRAFIAQLPEYESYIAEINAQLKHDSAFAELVHNAESTAPAYIRSEVARIAQKQKCNRARVEYAQTAFAQQRDIIDLHALEWQNSNPQRFTAYQRACADNSITSDCTYHLSPAAHALLSKYDLPSAQYSYFHGNALQHQLLVETITGIEQLSSISRPANASFNALVHDHALDIFDTARISNEMGYCVSSAQLIDLGSSLNAYLYAAIKGTAHGIRDGAHSAIVGTYQMIRHPIDSAQALQKLAWHIAELVHEYLPPMPPNEYASQEAWNAYAQRCEAVSHQWEQTFTMLRQQWDATTPLDKAEMAAYTAASLGANLIVSSKCLQLLGKAARSAKAEIAHFTQKAIKQGPSATIYRTCPGFALIKETETLVAAEAAQVSETTIAIETTSSVAIEPQPSPAVSHGKYKVYPTQNQSLLSTPIVDLARKIQNPVPMPPAVVNAGYAKELVFKESRLQHIFEGEVIVTANASGAKMKWGGGHLDYMGEMQNRGIITLQNKTVLSSGMIAADVWYDTMLIGEGKTFFPQSWTRETTIAKIIEALYAPLEITCENQRLVIEGITTDNINIKLVCDDTGTLITAYPFIKKKL